MTNDDLQANMVLDHKAQRAAIPQPRPTAWVWSLGICGLKGRYNLSKYNAPLGRKRFHIPTTQAVGLG